MCSLEDLRVEDLEDSSAEYEISITKEQYIILLTLGDTFKTLMVIDLKVFSTNAEITLARSLSLFLSAAVLAILLSVWNLGRSATVANPEKMSSGFLP